MEPVLLATKHNRIHRSKEWVTSLLWRRIGRKKRKRHSPATNSWPQPTIASLMIVVEAQIVVVTRLLENLHQHSSSESSAITTNDISTIAE